MYAFLYPLFCFICALFCMALANEKNRHGAVWFFLGAFFTLIALITLVGMPMLPERPRQVESMDEAMERLRKQYKK